MMIIMIMVEIPTPPGCQGMGLGEILEVDQHHIKINTNKGDGGVGKRPT